MDRFLDLNTAFPVVFFSIILRASPGGLVFCCAGMSSSAVFVKFRVWKLALADAVVSVFRKRAGAKTSPLVGNTPGNKGAGLSPPAQSTPKLKIPELDEETQKFAKKWNYSDEDLARVFGE